MKTFLRILAISAALFSLEVAVCSGQSAGTSSTAPFVVANGGTCEPGGCQFEIVDRAGNHVYNVGLYFNGEIQSFPTKGTVRMAGATEDVTIKWLPEGKAQIVVKKGTLDLTSRGSAHISGTFTPAAK